MLGARLGLERINQAAYATNTPIAAMAYQGAEENIMT